MTVDALKEKISSVIDIDGCSAEFYFLLKGNEGIEVKSFDIKEDDHAELENIFKQSVVDNIILKDDLSLIPLSSADDRGNAIYKYDLDDIPDELACLKTIIENEQFESFSLSSDDLSDLEGILILLGNQDKQLAIYKHQYPITLLKKNSGFSLMKALGESRFKKLDTDILKISPKFFG